MYGLSTQAQAILEELTKQLGSTFSFNDFREFVELYRDKPLEIKETRMSGDVSGTAFSLSDCDLIYIAVDLDTLSRFTSCLHEGIHVLRNEAMHLEDMTYAQFLPCHATFMQQGIYRSLAEETSISARQREHDAKVLEKLLIQRVVEATQLENQHIRSFYI